jgi:putative ABC transport system substrate-binding protein
MRRREFIALLSGVAAWPRAARAQPSAMPVIGFLSGRTPEQGRYLVAAVREGLKEAGFVEGRNVAIEYRWAEGQSDRLPALAEELVARNVAVIIAGGTSQQAKAATSVIPVVFTTGLDPVTYGLVASLNRPGGNVTGATFYSGALVGKQIELLREMAPKCSHFGLLVKPDMPSAEPQMRSAADVARATGITIEILRASEEKDFDAAFMTLARRPDPALIVSVDPYFDSRASQLVALAERHAIPTVYYVRGFAEAGGLMSYGASITDTYRQAGLYAGRILKGDKPGELPVQLPTKFELVINLKTAKAIGLEIPPSLLARADEVIE